MTTHYKRPDLGEAPDNEDDAPIVPRMTAQEARKESGPWVMDHTDGPTWDEVQDVAAGLTWSALRASWHASYSPLT